MGTNTVAAGAPAADADALRQAMVDTLRSWGGVRTAAVEAAMRAVPRHLFVPEAPLEQAYGPESVVTFRDQDGVAISSASGPGVVAAMLEQLGCRPGDRVLEIGAGTGYNAACLAELAGAGGSVTTVDIGADIVTGARRALAAAGYERVRVVHGNGADGVPDGAPYDRIIVTAGAWDVPPSWREQLAPGGRLGVPLRIRGVTRAVALELDREVWRSASIVECGFMPMRGPGAVGELNLELPPGRGVRIRVAETGLSALVYRVPAPWQVTVLPSPGCQVTETGVAVAVTLSPGTVAVFDSGTHSAGLIHSQVGRFVSCKAFSAGLERITRLGSPRVWRASAASTAGSGAAGPAPAGAPAGAAAPIGQASVYTVTWQPAGTQPNVCSPCPSTRPQHRPRQRRRSRPPAGRPPGGQRWPGRRPLAYTRLASPPPTPHE